MRIDEHGGTVRAYGYDPLYRLTQETVTDGAGEPLYSDSFAYDPVGNRLSHTRQEAGAAPATTAYAYDERDRLTSRDGVPWSWDPNGNLIAKDGEASYGWDFEDKLESVLLADGTEVRHTYSAAGLRVESRATEPGGAAASTSYLVDDSGSLSQVVAELDEAGNLEAYYVQGSGEVLAILRPASTRFYHADGLGSIRALTDETGAVTDRYRYSALGELLEHEGDDPQARLFVGETLDLNSGFYFLRARWMDPGAGRFASTDPFSGTTFDPRSLHRYTYASNNPVEFTDPSGLYATSTNSQAAAFAVAGLVAAIGLGFFIAVFQQTFTNLPEDAFQERPTHSIFGGGVSVAAKILARGNPYALFALAPLAGTFAFEILVGLSPPTTCCSMPRPGSPTP